MNFLWTDGQLNFFSTNYRENTRQSKMWMRLRGSLRLTHAARGIECIPFPKQSVYPAPNVIASVHRFEEIIGGRSYLIEVKAVSPDRWRAYIVRIPGVPTALMPFYGRTPDEAAHLLSEWLTRAYERVANQAPGV